MRARFYSNIAMENFVDEAFTIHEVIVVADPTGRFVVIQDCDHLLVEITALVQINGGEVIREDTDAC